MPATFTIAVLSDIHYGESPLSARQGDIGDVLLLRTIHRLNRLVRPEVTLVLGDLLDDPQADDARQRLEQLRDHLRLLESPLIVLPGNHDQQPDEFYQVMPRPPEAADIGGVRFLVFLDPEAPGYNATRLPHDLERLRVARRGWEGRLVAIQHVPLFPPGATGSPYNYTNVNDVLAATRTAGVDLTIAGHYHHGFDLIRDGRQAFYAAPALCEAPFRYCLIEMQGDEIRATHQTHQMRLEDGLFDYHTHTEFAYCGEDVTMADTVRLAEAFGLAGVAFTEHSGQLYFERATYWSGEFCHKGIDSEAGRQERMSEYWSAAQPHRRSRTLAGLEVDCDFRGRPVVNADDAGRADFLIGAIHWLPELQRKSPDLERAADEFLGLVESLARSGVRALAHPFRVFRRRGLPAPDRVLTPTVRLLREHGVAAELNFHTNEPPLALVKSCLDAGVRLCLGSDAHNRYEVGEFAPHLKLLRECDFNGDLRDILL